MKKKKKLDLLPLPFRLFMRLFVGPFVPALDKVVLPVVSNGVAAGTIAVFLSPFVAGFFVLQWALADLVNRHIPVDSFYWGVDLRAASLTSGSVLIFFGLFFFMVWLGSYPYSRLKEAYEPVPEPVPGPAPTASPPPKTEPRPPKEPKPIDNDFGEAAEPEDWT